MALTGNTCYCLIKGLFDNLLCIHMLWGSRNICREANIIADSAHSFIVKNLQINTCWHNNMHSFTPISNVTYNIFW